MRRDSFNVLFFIKKTKLLKNGEASVCMRITVNGARVETNIRKSIEPVSWNQAKECAKGKSRKSTELNVNQVTNISVDLRLGCDFLVSIKCRDPFIDATREHGAYENIYKFYQETRRQIGETFFLHPNQTIMASTLEYVKLPNNLMATIDVRSSYARLGLTMNSFLEPGYCGCISVVLTNTSMNPIKLAVGARMFTIKFSKVSDDTPPYFATKRKYMCQVRPVRLIYQMIKIWIFWKK